LPVALSQVDDRRSSQCGGNTTRRRFDSAQRPFRFLTFGADQHILQQERSNDQKPSLAQMPEREP
jgi:hypothetical protein